MLLEFYGGHSMKKKILIGLSAVVLAAGSLVSCGGEADPEQGTGAAVKKASQMTLAELEEASRKEFEDNAGETFKVVGLTSVLQSVASTFAAKYDWVHYKETGEGAQKDNVYVNNSYKDYALLTALDTADSAYFADYALVQDVRSFSTYLEDGILHNYVPSDWQEMGLKEEDTLPLKGVHFNKLFWTNKNFSTVNNGLTLYNIWQLVGNDQYTQKYKATDTSEVIPQDHPDHISKVSFQKPDTEQINMSFLISCYAEENQARILKAYKDYYQKDWAPSDYLDSDGKVAGTYQSAGEQWVREFIRNIKRWHSSDGTAMKETQLKEDWEAGFVYYGAFAKMKDAVGKFYTVAGQDTDPILKDLIIKAGDSNAGENNANVGKICAMDTVKWDWEINGFNGFMYCMDSQIINNAKFPYTACLFARTLLLQETYTKAIYNELNPAADGQPGNQYGYYYPGKADSTFRYAKVTGQKKSTWKKKLMKTMNS